MTEQSRSSEQTPTAEDEQRRRSSPGRRRDWADEAAQARTADDPRAVAPHDRIGVPSTGDER